MVSMGLALRAFAPLFHLPRLASRALQRPAQHRHGPGLIHATVELAPALQPRPLQASRILGRIAPTPAPHRPVRVLLRPQDGACRLALSGRMADVCAELNRLASL